jgi:NAD+ kinase
VSSSSTSSSKTIPSSPPSSTTGSSAPSRVARAAVVTHGKPENIGPALERVERVAREAGVELLYGPEERAKHELAVDGAELDGADVAIVLGGDGTMLRALARFLDARVPVVGVNFGRVGFLTSISAADLDDGLRRVLAGDYRVIELATLEVDVAGRCAAAINDIVAHSGLLGRMVELEWCVGGEPLGQIPCDGVICATPSGSTAYNLSNGGPVLSRGLDAMAVTFIAPHSLHARPVVVTRGEDVEVRNRTPDVRVAVLVDGHAFAEVEPGAAATVRLGDRRALLGTMPETTFFGRYRETFAH